ncbi:ABC transporter substrate-binding protein [Janthinobacterium agaricidamnosum]|uniref:Periplasmic substrate-binding component of ABC-type sulfonate/nitrate/taurine transport system n=1 Tax=Janthinobacterium agaricidamnosum NBRC 102515 = DSM 9628 TaxID=1349767 RepID=W0V3B3_9BURK|nr:ABC transporter substrate-binding protein [Janthinobacterium agaricidamnosum]CDG82361.1 periplasmic substrate-binding component of ABC-type sulfonate/nitrate/taurine transport system [Janthinobacterium agaricidamnosum NBRC 102515 = DSM 9628]
MTFNPQRRRLLGALPAAALLAACGDQLAGSPSASAAVDLSTVKLVLGDQVNLLRSKAEAAGVLEGVPYQIEWASFQGAAPLFEAVVSGDVDTAMAADTPALAAAAGGARIKVVAASVTSPAGVAILVPPGSSIKTVADLKGRSVIVSSARGSVAHYLLFGALREAGLRIDDVTSGFMLPGDAAVAFSSGRIEAWATFGTYQASAELRGARVLRDGIGINSGIGVITASDAALADPGKRAALADVLQRLSRSNTWANAHPAEYGKVFERITKLPPQVVKLVVGRDRPQLRAPDQHIVTQLQQVADAFYDARLFPRRVDARTLVDASLFHTT